MKSLYIVLILSLQLSLPAQDLIEVYFDKGHLASIVTVSPGYTIYGLCKSAHIDQITFDQSNPHIDGALSIGQKIKLPIKKEAVLDEPISHSHIPIIYTVQTGDNLYRIARSTGQSTLQLIQLNRKTNAQLGIGDTVLVGYIDWPFTQTQEPEPLITVSQTKDKTHMDTQSALDVELVATTLDTVKAAPTEIIIQQTKKEKGIAYWEESDYVSTELIVMHPTARVNSKISLYNPMLKTKVHARVVSPLPKEAYPEEISVVISPSVASALGALDRRFKVEMTYIE